MSEELYSKWIEREKDLIEKIKSSQSANIEKAAQIAADSITDNHVMFMFGSGHSIIPIEEIYPRYGGIVGFMPINDLPLSFFTQIVGNLGFSQFNYLENNAAYADSIIENYKIHRQDSLLIFSHSGSTPVTMEIAIKFKEMGGKVVGVTSLHRCLNSKSKHPSGKNFTDVCDVIIDTSVPDSDVAIEINGVGLGPLSSIGVLTIANLLSIGTYSDLVRRGVSPLVNPVRAFDIDADSKMHAVIEKYRELYSAHISGK